MSQMGHGETNSPRAFLVRSTPVSRPSGGGADGLLSAQEQTSCSAAEVFHSITSLAREQQHRPLGETKTLMRAAASLRLFAARVIVLPAQTA
jgi:hypothetical protein